MRLLSYFLPFLLIINSCKDEASPTDPSASDRPNILLIIADDIGIEATPNYPIGDQKPNMPQLSELASKGITFDNVWAYPVCSPTRASILTGKYGVHTGVLNAEQASTINTNEKTLQSYLDEETNNAYAHAIIGKWHLSNGEPERPTQMGIDYYAGLLGGGVGNYNSWQLTENGQSAMYSGYITTKITDLAINWIQTQEQPWFCWLAYTAPHTPFHVPPSEMHSQGDLPSDQASIDANPFPYFMAMTESIDYEVGRLFAQIPSEELDNTLIIFLGDNGSHPQVVQAPYVSTRAKGSLYQGGIHVPMIIAGKGVSRMNERDDNLISSTDLFSTIAAIAGANANSYEDSESFAHLLESAGTHNRAYNYSEVLNENANKSGYTIRNKDYKLMVLDNGQERFYELSSDPYENQNLINSSLSTEQNNQLELLRAKALEFRQ